MRRSERHETQDLFSDVWLYGVWPTRIADTVSGLELSAALFERDGDSAKAEQIRKGIKAFEGRDSGLW